MFNFKRRSVEEGLSDYVCRARDGDQKAIQEIYEQTSNNVYFVAKKFVSDEQTVFDILQDAYVIAFSKLSQLDDDNKFPQWINRIVANKAKDYLKKKKPFLFTDTTEDDQNIEEFIEDDKIEFNPSETYNYNELKEAISNMIDELSEENRMCILMFYYQQLSINEIADILDISPNTVKSRLNYGKKQIKRKVEEVESTGTKLRSVAPIPLFLYILKDLASSTIVPEVVSTTTLAAIGGTAVGTGVITIAGVTIATATVAKVIAGVSAVAVLATAGILINNQQLKQKETVDINPPSETQPHPIDTQTALNEDTWRVVPSHYLDERPIALYDKGFLLTENGKSKFVDIDNTVVFEKQEKYRQCLGEDAYAFVYPPKDEYSMEAIHYVVDLIDVEVEDKGICSGIGGTYPPVVYFSDRQQVYMLMQDFNETGTSFDTKLKWVLYQTREKDTTEIIEVDTHRFDNPQFDYKETKKYIVFRNDKPISHNIYDEVRTVYITVAGPKRVYGLAALRKGDKWKLINEEGINLTSNLYDDMEVLNKNYAYFKLGDEMGLLDNKGNILFQGKYDDLSAPANGVIMVRKNGIWGFMDLK
ncbi:MULTISPECIES: sigma-70 family RNA polymerase sigma factor [unclassified Breznakia]|uniref:sigma-70 family RNA polymerase sigma factor n=1 Tax=unclassified Breznakia TaxID=2623764 RepID=UPI002405DF1A|nr:MULTISPECIES: sigma-70 family RNA polymerase sigma factor [unclassified Breznakia]